MFKKLREAQEIVAGDRNEVIDALLKLSTTDFLFFWGIQRELVERQEKLWAPIIEWLEDALSTKINQTDTLNVPKQDEGSGAKIRQFLCNLSDKELAVYYVATLTLRSVLLAAAFVKRKINADEAFNAAYVEELWQNEGWGTVDEAQDRQKEIKDELNLLEKFLDDKSF